MTSSEIRQSFLDFFKSKQHTIVPSSSLMPDSPNLLFTNAGMNQFVPIFLGQQPCPYQPGRAADTQKCIRAGGKHNDLEDVGLDTYHHTFFEMLGNWSFGDYFKKEAIEWAWELVAGEKWWKFPKNRLYATVFCPYLGEPGWEFKWREEFEMVFHHLRMGVPKPPDVANNDALFQTADLQAIYYWAQKFESAGLDPFVHIVPGNKKDNFWMMGETGPCGPCSEIHVDLTPQGDTKGALVNKGSAECIEIWNLVFIQFNANPDGTFTPLPAKHVDTGMGFERVTSIMQCTKGFTTFTDIISNYETDIFRPIFDKLEKMSDGKRYKSTLPKAGSTGNTEQEKIDVAFRVIADHIRTLSFAIADGILPGNNDRNYVLRRILRRAVKYGRTLDFHKPFFYELVDTLAEKMGHVFPEILAKKEHVKSVIGAEEEAFNKTLDRGLELFEIVVRHMQGLGSVQDQYSPANQELRYATAGADASIATASTVFPGSEAFKLYDTYGFPLDLTELMARERGLTVDTAGFEKLMEEQRARSQAAIKRTVIKATDFQSDVQTAFVGYDALESSVKILQVVDQGERALVITDQSPFYTTMGGQVGDSGFLRVGPRIYTVEETAKFGHAIGHFVPKMFLETYDPTSEDNSLAVTIPRRQAIQRHHTVTHLFHWALHEVASKDALQKGSYVGPEKLTFDFNSAPLTPQQIRDIEKLVNERIVENAPVSWTEIANAEAKARTDITQVFGEKYGDRVRVVQIGGEPQKLNGYSMELCGGTHTRSTGEIGLFKIIAESATGAGIRRVEAVAGPLAYAQARHDADLLIALAGKVNSPLGELEKKIDALLAHQKDLEKALKSAQQREAAHTARGLLAKARPGAVPAIIENLGAADGDTLQSIADSLKGQFRGVILLGGAVDGNVSLVAAVTPDFTAKVQAGKIIQAIAPLVGGKGGGRPDNARGGGKDSSKIDEALAKGAELIAQAGK